jgi:predicted nuclease with TOPRIM domain
MSEDLTRKMPDSFEERVLAELAAIRRENSQLSTRLTALEEKVDARLHDTRPMWEGVQQRLMGIEKEMATLNRQFRSLIHESFDVRSRVDKLEDEQAARES